MYRWVEQKTDVSLFLSLSKSIFLKKECDKGGLIVLVGGRLHFPTKADS